jgi:hypothetical protein
MQAAIGVFESGIREALSFTLDDLVHAKPDLDWSRILAVLTEMSIEIGSLEPTKYTGLLDESPLRERPFLKLNDDYLLPIPGMLDRDADTLLERRLLAGRPGFSRQRAKSLDRLAAGYLASMLPGAETYTNLFYEDTELDGLVLFEDTAFVIEGKGGDISVPARRGDIERLTRDIATNIEEALEQGARARTYILADEESVFSNERGEEVLRLPPRTVREVIVVNPTLHELAGHAPQLGRLRALGLFPDEKFPWSVYINDLRVIAETSDNAAVFLHYLTWRNRLPLGTGVSVGDEIDLWASYLLCERFGLLHDGGEVMIANASTDFDAYYEGVAGRGPQVDRPGKFLEEPVKSFVARMAEERPPGWRTATGACLDLSIPELAVIAGKADEVAAMAAAEAAEVWFDADRVALLGIPPGSDPVTTVAEFMPGRGDPTLVVACAMEDAGNAEVVWADYRKPVTFELSAWERAVFDGETASPFDAPDAKDSDVPSQ